MGCVGSNEPGPPETRCAGPDLFSSIPRSREGSRHASGSHRNASQEVLALAPLLQPVVAVNAEDDVDGFPQSPIFGVSVMQERRSAVSMHGMFGGSRGSPAVNPLTGITAVRSRDDALDDVEEEDEGNKALEGDVSGPSSRHLSLHAQQCSPKSPFYAAGGSRHRGSLVVRTASHSLRAGSQSALRRFEPSVPIEGDDGAAQEGDVADAVHASSDGTFTERRLSSVVATAPHSRTASLTQSSSPGWSRGGSLGLSSSDMQLPAAAPKLTRTSVFAHELMTPSLSDTGEDLVYTWVADQVDLLLSFAQRFSLEP